MNKYYPLPEWSPQDACVIVWPHPHSDWKSRLDQISETYVDLVKSIALTQTVIVVHFDNEHKKRIKALCDRNQCNMQALHFAEIKTNDTWVRDFGPLFLSSNRHYKYLNLQFHAWGEQYEYELDNQFSHHLYEIINKSITDYTDVPLIIEGGNVDFNGRGACLINYSSLIKNNPTKDLAHSHITEQLTRVFQVKHIIGISVDALMGDDTHGHVDTLARFINDDQIVYAHTNDTRNANYACLHSLQEQLIAMAGQTYQLIPIELPAIEFMNKNGQALPASYINFVFTNESLLVPIYNDENDEAALNLFKELCPDRKVV